MEQIGDVESLRTKIDPVSQPSCIRSVLTNSSVRICADVAVEQGAVV